MGHKGAKREKKRGKKGRQQASLRAPAEVAAAASAAPALERPSEVDVDLTELASPVPEPPPFAPVARMQSGFAPRMPDPPRVDDETLSDHLVSLQPLYRDTDGKRDERASELELEDLSLRMDGAYMGSPLTSVPAVRTRPLGMRIARAAGVALLAASSGYGVWSAVQDLRAWLAPEPERVEQLQARRTPTEVVPAPPSPSPSALAPIEAPRIEPVPVEPVPVEPAPVEPPPATTALDEQAAAPGAAPLVEPPELARSRALRVRRPIVDPAPEAPPAAAPVAGSAPATATLVTAVSTGTPLASGAAATTEAAALPATAPAATLPKRPSPADVRASFRQIQPTMRACANGRQGLVTIRAVVAGSGRVNSGSVEGAFPGLEERACMTRAILELRFPPFEQDVFEIAYPLSL